MNERNDRGMGRELMIPGLGEANVLDRRQRAAVEFVAWCDHHAHERRRHQALQAQVETHPDRLDARNAVAQQRAWARRETHLRHLHDSALAQLRHR